MENIINIWKSMGVLGYIIPAVFVLYTVFLVIYMRRQGNRQKQWLATHPDAVKVYLQSDIGLLTSGSVQARIVSGEAYPGLASEGTKMVLYALPGNIEVEMSYTYTRPGVIYKNVTTTWGPTQISLSLEAGKTYVLTFDRKEENFVFHEK